MPSIRKRNPWIAVAFTFFVMPFIGMLYLGKGRRAFIYLALTFAAAGVTFWLASKGLWPRGIGWIPLVYVLVLIGAIDAYRIARRSEVPFAGPTRAVVAAFDDAEIHLGIKAHTFYKCADYKCAERFGRH